MALGLVLLRRPGGLLHPAFWAEDGAVFYLQQQTVGFVPFRAYQGQVWLLQRVVAPAAGWVSDPVVAAGLFYAMASAIAVLGLSVVLTRRAEEVFGKLGYAVVVFSLLVLLPGVWEVQGNLANLHVWAAVSAMICLTLPPPRTRWGRVVELVWLTLVAFSGFSAVILLPMVVWSAMHFRSRYGAIRSALMAAGSTAAVVVWLLGGRTTAGATDLPGRLWVAAQAVLERVGGTLVRGEEHTEGVAWVIGAAALLALVLLVTLADRRGPSPIWLACGGVWLALGALSQPPGGARFLLVPYMHGRYFTLLLAACILVLGRGLADEAAAPSTRIMGGAALVLACVGTVVDYRLPDYRPMTDQESQGYSRCIDARDPHCSVPVRPDGWIRPDDP